MIKKIEDLDYYEILNLGIEASAKDIENAYLLAVATYHHDSLASYGVLVDKERVVILDKIEAAFQTLSNPEKRKFYDARVRERPLEIPPKASFRRSTGRLLIEDASERETLWDKIKSIVAPVRRRAESRGPDSLGSGRDRRDASDDSYYFGDFLKKVRERRGLSLEDIAKKCGVEPIEIRSLEEEPLEDHSIGKNNQDLLKCYARNLGLDPENGKDFPFPTRFH